MVASVAQALAEQEPVGSFVVAVEVGPVGSFVVVVEVELAGSFVVVGQGFVDSFAVGEAFDGQELAVAAQGPADSSVADASGVVVDSFAVEVASADSWEVVGQEPVDLQEAVVGAQH